MLCSTAIAAVLALMPQPGNAGDAPKPAAAQTKLKPARTAASANSWALPDAISPDIIRKLSEAQWSGRNGLVAGVIDEVRARPAMRDAVVNYAQGLAPMLKRDLATAGDLAVLTANEKLVLAPSAASAGPQRAAATTSTVDIAAAFAQSSTAAAAGPRAVPANPPSAADQTWNLTMIGAQIANGRGYTGAGVTVAVADTGFDVNHDALKNRLDLTRARNYVVNTPATNYDPTFVGLQSNTDSHGSHVAGIIAAEIFPGMSMRGVAYDSKIVPIRLLLAGKQAPEADYAERGDQFADSLDYFGSLANVQIYNASYGPNPSGKNLSVWSMSANSNGEATAAQRAIAASGGKIIVAAAGNERDDHPIAGRNPSGLALYPYIQPAHAKTGVYDDGGANLDYSALLKQSGMIISVMAVGDNKQAASYSNFCGVTASWCVAAPGGDFDNTAGKLGVYSTVPVNTYDALQGTSMAAPTVSGALAVLIQAYPGYSARDLARLLFSTSEDIGAPGVDNVYGYGLIRLDRATEPVTAPANGASVTVAANTTTYWAPPVNTGAFTKVGSGVLTIAGITTSSGTVSVNQGTFAVDGTLNVTGTGNTLSINSGGVLAGFGQIGGNTTIAGILSPGKMPNVQDQGGAANFTINSPGTLTFNGNVNLLSSATTAIAIDGNLNVPGGPGTFSKIVVSGAGNVFTANGTLAPVTRGIAGGVNTYVAGLGTQLRIVEAQNGAITAGKFRSIRQPTDGLAANTRFDATYTSGWIDLSVVVADFGKEFATKTLSPDQTAIEKVVQVNRSSNAGTSEAASTQLTASEQQFFDAFNRLNSDDAYLTAFRQLAGPGQVASPSTAMMALTGFSNTISDRQSTVQTAAADVQSDLAPSAALAYDRASTAVEARQAAGGAFASVDRNNGKVSDEGWSTWGRAFGGWSSVDSQNGVLGAKTRSGGLSLGADRLLAPDLIGGIAGGFVRANSSNDDGNARYDSFTGALYASWTPGRWVLDMRTALGTTSITTSRTLNLTTGTINGSTSGLGAGADIELGYRIPLGPIASKPFVGLSTQVFRRKGYSESQQPFGLTFPDQTFTKVATTLGVTNSILVRRDGWNFMPEVKLAWGHDLRDSTLTTQAALLDTPFTVSNVEPGKDAALVGLTLTAWQRAAFRLFTSYNGEYRTRARSHQVSLGARANW